MAKKFKVRVSYFGNGKYTVDYCHYYLIPICWNSINFWFQQSLTGGTECWSTDLFTLKEAESLAKTLKSIEDVNRYYKPLKEDRLDFYKRQKEYYKENVPYKTKYFN